MISCLNRSDECKIVNHRRFGFRILNA
jgi:hypothetical protein